MLVILVKFHQMRICREETVRVSLLDQMRQFHFFVVMLMYSEENVAPPCSPIHIVNTCITQLLTAMCVVRWTQNNRS